MDTVINTEILIGAIRENPELWNMQLPDYKNKGGLDKRGQKGCIRLWIFGFKQKWRNRTEVLHLIPSIVSSIHANLTPPAHPSYPNTLSPTLDPPVLPSTSQTNPNISSVSHSQVERPSTSIASSASTDPSSTHNDTDSLELDYFKL
ncbi:hypothetical protein EVAR_19957_1 [Eumeta japonica]|uniref:Uncharacterized protein n=1 Tax=Eumeta variegata TaxID=151549 RepID=A0A4C1YGV6_EUMVA|nr:hypothetical protein EVAR_19957_1 [Eumeta japonica]